MATLYKNVRLLKIVVRAVPSVADAISLLDTASSPNTLWTATVPTSGTPPYDFGPDGIPTPAGGFLITTTQASGSYMLVFDGQASVA